MTEDTEHVRQKIQQGHKHAESVKDEVIVAQIGAIIENPIASLKALSVGVLLPDSE